jgi:hypothetical protein
MLDLSIQASGLEESFDRIAQQLMQGFVLRIGTPKQPEALRYQLTELEFYYNNEQGAFDNFAHRHRLPYPNGTWRLHGAGLDVVLSEEGVYYGGILLRGVQLLDAKNQPNGTYIDGPWNTATRCIRQKGAATAALPFYLEALEAPLTVAFFKSPRVGLSLRKVEDLKYICRRWRYSSVPLHSQRYRQLLYLQAYVDESPLQEQLGLAANTCRTYVKHFEEGSKMAAEDFVNGGTGVHHTCRLFGYCYQHGWTT